MVVLSYIQLYLCYIFKVGIKLGTLEVVGIDLISKCKTNDHTIMSTMAP